jgi:uncharacterized membrane protein YdjX (TVP38/TMEM64 family)
VAEQRRFNLKAVALVVALVALMVLAKFFGLGERLGSLRGWIESLGAYGPLAFSALYVAAVIAMIPGFAITVAAGALFGSIWGTVYVSIGSTIGAALCFLIARYFARESVSTWLARSTRFRHLDEMTEQHGAIFVAITRLVPLFPFNLLNYGFGLTKVKFTTYVFWSWLCMLPGTVVYVVGTDAFITTLREGKIPWALLIALAVVSALIALLVRAARRKLAHAAANESAVSGTSQVSEA